jgi:hypothetical protein
MFVPNELILKKLVYLLVHSYDTRREQLLHYAKESTMRHYYVSPTDFEPKPLHHILVSESSYLSYVKHQHDTIESGFITIQPYAKRPYVLFKTFESFPATRYIMQPVSSFSHAMYVSHQWNELHINKWADTSYPISVPKFHSIVWTSEYDADVYRQPDATAMCSIIRTRPSQDTVVVQVMLPF